MIFISLVLHTFRVMRNRAVILRDTMQGEEKKKKKKYLRLVLLSKGQARVFQPRFGVYRSIPKTLFTVGI